MVATVRVDEARRTETPNATMTTLASPTLGGSAGLSLWRVDMSSGARGPRHSFDSEQLWTVLEGAVSVIVGDEVTSLGAGDTMVLPGNLERQITARTTSRLMVCGHGDAAAQVTGEDTPRGTPPWIA